MPDKLLAISLPYYFYKETEAQSKAETCSQITTWPGVLELEQSTPLSFSLGLPAETAGQWPSPLNYF